jgi:glycosyltransferase involved in cell wall biosynthesis
MKSFFPKDKKMPLISVLMTSYNREQYIGEAIESVIASTWTDWELIIVDDCSKDRTVDIARLFAAKDNRIHVYVNEKNLGDYPNRNKAASYAQGEFIMYVDSDDKILSDGFKHCITAMQRFPQAGFGMQYNASLSEPFIMDSEQVIKKHFFEKSSLMIGPGGTIIRKSFFDQIGGYPEKYGPANDLYFNLRAASIGGILFLPFVFNYYRIHEGQEINNKYSYLYNNYNYLSDALYELDLNLTGKEKEWLMNKNKRRFLTNLIFYLLRSGSIKKTIEAYARTDFRLIDIKIALFHRSL